MIPRIVGIALLAVGIMLLIWGINSLDSFSSDVQEFFTGEKDHDGMWMVVGGTVACILGLGGLFLPMLQGKNATT